MSGSADPPPMRRELRLTKSRDFAAVRAGGRGWSDRFLVLLARRNCLPVSRIGLSVGRHIGIAVVRNRTKRRLREALGTTGVVEGWDMVVIARKGASTADFHTLRRSVTDLLRRAGISTGSAANARSTTKVK